MTDITSDILALRDALAKGPTPGVWHWEGDPVGDSLDRVRFQVVTIGKTVTKCYYSSSDPHAEADARHIAAAHPERIARLLDALEQAQKDAEAFRAIVDGMVSVDFTPKTVRVGSSGRANLNTLRKQCGIAEFVRRELAAMKEQQ